MMCRSSPRNITGIILFVCRPRVKLVEANVEAEQSGACVRDRPMKRSISAQRMNELEGGHMPESQRGLATTLSDGWHVRVYLFCYCSMAAVEPDVFTYFGWHVRVYLFFIDTLGRTGRFIVNFVLNEAQ
jgi:hypothetical protein